MQKAKRFGAILLALVMLAVLIPALPSAVAATSGDYEYTVEDGNATKAVTGLKLTTPAAKQLKVTYKAVSGADGYRIEYSTSKSFTKSTTKTVHTTKLTYTLKSLSAKKTYYVRVTAYKIDSTKAKIYSTKTATKSLKTK